MPRQIYVSTTGSDTAGDGSVANPYLTIMKGLGEAISGDTVRVAAGTYAEDVTMTPGVVLQGAGASETTVQIGSLTSEQTVKVANAGRDTKIDGFTITGGTVHVGRGITCEEASPTISNNIVTGNVSSDGGGISCIDGSDALITQNIIDGNAASVCGGGVYCSGSSPVIVENTITANAAGQGGAVNGFGGGIYCGDYAGPVVERNVISGNSAQGSDGGMGGGISYRTAHPTIDGNTISDNLADAGGGICCMLAPEVFHAYVPLTIDPILATIDSNAVVGNQATYGGGVYGPPDMSNCVIAGNQSDWGGAVFRPVGTIHSSTIADNEAWWTGGVFHPGPGAADAVASCIVWGNTDMFGGGDLDGCGAIYSDISSVEDTAGVGNISVDPSFVDPETGDYHLRSDSPCIDAGTNTGAPAADMDEVPRPLDGDNDGVAVSDMGAYERPYMQIDGGNRHTKDLTSTVQSFFDICVEMRWRNESGQWTPWSPYAASVEVTLSGSDGTRTIDAQYRYGSGRTLMLSDGIVLDRQAPGRPSAFRARASDRRVDLSWANPTGDFAAVRVLRSTADYAPGPDPGAGQTLIYEGSGQACADTGLANGTRYYYSIFSRDPAGNYSTRAVAVATPSAPTAMSIRVVRSSSSYNTAVTITGVLTSGRRRLGGLGNVRLWRSVDGRNWRADRAAMWNSTGRVYFVVRRIAATTYFRLRFGGTPAYRPSVSALKSATCRAYLGRPWLSTRRPARRRVFYTSGYLRPRHGGTTRLYFYRYVRGRWRYFTYRYATNRAYSSATACYRLRYALPYAGRWYVRAYHRDRNHLATWGPPRVFTVR